MNERRAGKLSAICYSHVAYCLGFYYYNPHQSNMPAMLVTGMHNVQDMIQSKEEKYIRFIGKYTAAVVLI